MFIVQRNIGRCLRPTGAVPYNAVPHACNATNVADPFSLHSVACIEGLTRAHTRIYRLRKRDRIARTLLIKRVTIENCSKENTKCRPIKVNDITTDVHVSYNDDYATEMKTVSYSVGSKSYTNRSAFTVHGVEQNGQEIGLLGPYRTLGPVLN